MRARPQRLLGSIRGKKEALAAARGGAHIADVEYPASALGTPYPLNIQAVRKALPKSVAVATNIGEEQPGRSTACQAALGVALAGVDIVKLGLARMPLGEAKEFGPALVRTVRKWFPRKQLVPALFADSRLAKWYIDPLKHGPDLAAHMRADGLLIDTFDKGLGMGPLDYYSLRDVRRFVQKCHETEISHMDAAAALYCAIASNSASSGPSVKARFAPIAPSQREMQRFRLSRRLQAVLSETVLLGGQYGP